MLSQPAADHLRRSAILSSLCLIGCALAGMVNAWSFLLSLFAMVLGLPTLALLFVTLGAWISWQGLKVAGRSAPSEWPLVALAAPGMMLALVALAMPAVRSGYHAGWLIRLVVSEADYHERIIAARHRQQKQIRLCGLERGASRCADLNRPLRLAFDGEGWLNAWSSVVFDPTGDVMRRGAIGEEESLDAFGGMLLGCEPLYRDFYLCSFA